MATKLVDTTELDNNLTSIANAIRAKSGTEEQLAFPSGFVDAIDGISANDDRMVYIDRNVYVNCLSDNNVTISSV